MANEDFKFDSNYNPDASFARVKFGVNRPILETELNELQKINEERITNFVRQNVPTGFSEIVKKDFVGDMIVYNPNELENSIAIAPSRLIMNGYNVSIEGKDVVNGVDGYTIIDLGQAPNAGSTYCNFIYLELWFEELNAQSPIYKGGHVDGEVIQNSMVDDRVGAETSRRVGIRYKFVSSINIDSKKWPMGFGYNSDKDYSPIYASGPKNSPIVNQNYLFINATNDMFRNTVFYKDSGLYVAGRPGKSGDVGYTDTNFDFGVLENYIFAIPIMCVKRRNKGGYSLSNPFGAVKYVGSGTLSDRPDGLFFNRIDSRDVEDMRKTVTYGQLNTTKLLDTSIRDLMNGSLKTNKLETLVRSQFGITPIELYDDSNYNNNAIFHVKFRNQTLTPTIGLAGTATSTPNYHLAASGYGLSLDGNVAVSYPINTFFKEGGTIEFFLKPYWDGADEGISQTIISISNDVNYPLLQLKKDRGTLVVKFNYSTDESLSTYTIASLRQFQMHNNEIYQIRFTWQSSISGSESKIYINGNLVASGAYTNSGLQAKKLIIGYTPINETDPDVEVVNSYSPDYVGCVIDELVMYSKVLDNNNFIQLSNDIISGDAVIHPSFNGVLTGFKDNINSQKIVTPVITTPSSNSFTLSVPYGLTIDGNSPLVVYDAQSGAIYDGVWSNFVANSAMFTLSSTGTPSSFTGETIWVTHNVIVPGSFGIKDIPNKILKATINDEEMSFAGTLENQRPITLVNPDGSIEKVHKAYDYNSTRDADSGYARLIEYKFTSNGTNIYALPDTLYGRSVLGVKNVDKPLTSVTKLADGSYEIALIDELPYNESFTATVALGGFTFEYETYTKSTIVNIMKAATIKIPTTGNTKNYTIPAMSALSENNILDPSGGIIVAYLGLNGFDANYNPVNFGTTVFITGSQFNYFAKATVTGVGTPFINIAFETTPQAGHFIEIPVMVSYQPKATDILSVWYEYVPYQGIITADMVDDMDVMNIKRLTSWKIFCTTLGSGKIVANNLKDKSINNASNRLPGGQNYSYLLDGSDVEFVGEQITVPASLGANYNVNKKLVFKNQFTELIFDSEYDNDINSLDTEFTISKRYGQNHQDAFLSGSISDITFAISDTKQSINKYLGATCLVIDEDGNIYLLVVGEIKTTKTSSSIINPIHGDLFKLNGNPLVVIGKY